MSRLTKFETKAYCLSRLATNPALKLNPSHTILDYLTYQIDNCMTCFRNRIWQPWNDWNLIIKKSKIDNCNRGLFINGFAPAGRLISFYSGEIWTKNDINKGLQLLKEGDINIQNKFDNLFSFIYAYARSDGSIIDSTPSDLIHKIYKSNPLATGYLINHPPKDSKPNLLAVDVPKILNGDELNHKLTYPIIWNDNDNIIQDNIITCFIAMRDLKDEELYFDYELEDTEEKTKQRKESGNIPEWYYHISKDVYLEGQIWDNNDQNINYEQIQSYVDEAIKQLKLSQPS